MDPITIIYQQNTQISYAFIVRICCFVLHFLQNFLTIGRCHHGIFTAPWPPKQSPDQPIPKLDYWQGPWAPSKDENRWNMEKFGLNGFLSYGCFQLQHLILMHILPCPLKRGQLNPAQSLKKSGGTRRAMLLMLVELVVYTSRERNRESLRSFPGPWDPQSLCLPLNMKVTYILIKKNIYLKELRLSCAKLRINFAILSFPDLCNT